MTDPSAPGADRPRSKAAYEEARRHIPGGVNSPVRAFKGVGGHPAFITSGSGCRIRDLDGREYIDYVGSFGPLILGHAHPAVVEAVREAAGRGLSYGAPTEAETRLARRITEAVPSVDRVRFVNSGTEAALSGARLVRAWTGREGLVKFAGGYHGHVDDFLATAGSAVADTEASRVDLAPRTEVLPFNDFDAVREVFRRRGDSIAAVFVEPIPCNMGVIPPADGFLALLREETEKAGALLVFDEVITGFRVGPAGAQGLLGVDPDITMFGKVIGGGMPVGAYGGRAEILDRLAPDGEVYQAGTLSGNPVAMAAGHATLEETGRPGFYERLDALGARLADGIVETLRSAGLPISVNRVGSLIGLFLTEGEVGDFESARAMDRDLYARLFHALLRRGVYWAPSPLEALFVSAAHGESDIDETLAALREACAELASA